MSRNWTYVGVYAIASVISTLIFLVGLPVILHERVDLKYLLYGPIGFTFYYLPLSLPFVLLFEKWLYRFGFVKGMAVIHFVPWFMFMIILNVRLLVYGVHDSEAFMELLAFNITAFLLYPLPITLGAIIMNWLIHHKETLSESFRNPEKIKMILREHFRRSEKIKMMLRGIRALLACLHSLFKKVLFK